MSFGSRYSAPTLYAYYRQEMSKSDVLISLPVYKYETIRDQLRAESKVKGSWLSVEDGEYFKTAPKCVFSKAHNYLIKRSKLWFKTLLG